MELTAAVAILVAAIAPFVVAIFTHPTMQPWIKRLIAGTVAVVLAIMVSIATGKITGVPADWISGLTWVIVTAAVIVSLADGFYRAWKPAVKAVESATALATVEPMSSDFEARMNARIEDELRKLRDAKAPDA